MTTIARRGPVRPGPPLSAAEAEYAAADLLDPDVLAWVNAAAGQGRCAARNRAAFEDATLTPRVLCDVSRIVTETVILNERWPLPIAVAPMAYHALVHDGGEIATVTGAASTGTPVCVSMFASRLIEDIAAANSAAPLWLQLYPLKDWDLLTGLARRAKHVGYQALMLTADSPILGQRSAPFPARDGIGPVNLPQFAQYATPAGHNDIVGRQWTWPKVRQLRHETGMPVIVKGVMDPRDARLAAEYADALIVSNHGGRQLDHAPATLTVLPEIAAAVGREIPVLLDSGVRTGADVALALANGADAVMVGRPILHALAAAGADGVQALLEQLGQDLLQVMTLTGGAQVSSRAPLVRRITRASPLHPRGRTPGTARASPPWGKPA